jgi:DNA repair protein RadC
LGSDQVAVPIADIARPLGTVLPDHIIIGWDGHVSLKTMGLM